MREDSFADTRKNNQVKHADGKERKTGKLSFSRRWEPNVRDQFCGENAGWVAEGVCDLFRRAVEREKESYFMPVKSWMRILILLGLTAILLPGSEIANRAGAVLLCLRHLAKSGGRKAIYRGLGSNRLHGGARQLLRGRAS
jgi:hypothetical protein